MFHIHCLISCSYYHASITAGETKIAEDIQPARGRLDANPDISGSACPFCRAATLICIQSLCHNFSWHFLGLHSTEVHFQWFLIICILEFSCCLQNAICCYETALNQSNRGLKPKKNPQKPKTKKPKTFLGAELWESGVGQGQWRETFVFHSVHFCSVWLFYDQNIFMHYFFYGEGKKNFSRIIWKSDFFPYEKTM